VKVDIAAMRAVEREKGLEFDTVVEALENALASAYKRAGGEGDEARVMIGRDDGEVTVYGQRTDEDGNVLSEWEDYPRDFGRIVAKTAKQVLTQRLREAQRDVTYGEYAGREGDLVTGTVEIHDNRTVFLDLGNAKALLPPREQVATESYDHGTRLKAWVSEVNRGVRHAEIVCSRRNPSLVSALFGLEVPEISDGTVTVEGAAREAGYRSKIAVRSQDSAVDPVGACVGPQGQRVLAVVDELGGEKVDIVPWADHPGEFIANALSPSKVTAVHLYEEDDPPIALVVVPDYQLSLAIGREGQNARLAARLTGWRIDIQSESEYAGQGAAAGLPPSAEPEAADASRGAEIAEPPRDPSTAPTVTGEETGAPR